MALQILDLCKSFDAQNNLKYVKGYKLYKKIIPEGENLGNRRDERVLNWDCVARWPDKEPRPEEIIDGICAGRRIIFQDDLSQSSVTEGSQVFYKVTVLVESPGKYAYESEATYETEPFIFSTSLTHDTYAYGKNHPFARKYLIVLETIYKEAPG